MILSYDNERKLIRTILQAYGMEEKDADIVGEVVTYSDFTGVYSHGLSRLILYIRQLENGSMNPRPKVKTLYDQDAVIRYDCDNGSGIVAVNMAYEALTEKARRYGLGIATGMHSGNIGCGAYYGYRAAQDGLICLACCNTLPSMAPYGGADALIGTNPIVVGVPAGENPPVILDMSTSGVAMGKIQAAVREGSSIPEGWANDIDGVPTTDASKAHTVLPIAGHKGYGLAVAVDILSAVLANAEFGTNTGTTEPLTTENTGFCILVIDPSRFMPMDMFKERMDEYTNTIKNSRKAPGVKDIYLPGEIEKYKFEDYCKSGVEISEALAADLCKYAAKVGLICADDSLEKLLELSK